ncbi:MAG: hypothetical protein GY868_21770, partial [Deltaproteobacteria bacterium]|nr:hypothetical protein [Deltaproteobacteria bacterium]
MNLPAGPETPDKQTCLMIMQDHGMLENILQHSIMVCNVALSIGKSINK